MTKLIIFDFWGTIIENGVRPSPSKQVKYYLRLRIPFSQFIVTFEEAFMTKQHENLKNGFEDVVKAFDKKIPDFVYDKLVGMWNKFSILSHPYEDTLTGLEDLKKDYKLVILSNTDNFSLKQVIDKYDLEKYFDKIYQSCETGLLKSNPASYEQIFKDFDVKAEDCLMIGDSPQSDIVSAEKANVPAILIDRRGWCEDMPKITSLADVRDFIKNGPTEPVKKEVVVEEAEVAVKELSVQEEAEVAVKETKGKSEEVVEEESEVVQGEKPAKKE